MQTTQAMSRFAREEQGSITVFSLFMVMMILIVTGAAVDIMRHETLRASMQGSIDHAVLAAADLDQERPPEIVVRDYLDKAGLSAALAEVKVEESMTHRSVTARGQAPVDTFFLRMSGFDSLDIHALSEAEENISQVEISLVLDISGSMRHEQRMMRLKPAAQAFVDTVLSRDPDTTSINLVPYAGQVNPGPEVFDWLQGQEPVTDVLLPPEATDHVPAWRQDISNVVMYFDTNGDGVHNHAHKIESFPSQGSPGFVSNDVDDFLGAIWAHAALADPDVTWDDTLVGVSVKGGTQPTAYFDVAGNDDGAVPDAGPMWNTGPGPGATTAWGALDIPALSQAFIARHSQLAPVEVPLPSSCIELAQAEFGHAGVPSPGAPFVPHFMYWTIAEDVMDWGWCPQDDTAIRYLAIDAAALSDFIDGIRMHDGTGTHYGMKWALALLSPEARGLMEHMIDQGRAPLRHSGRPLDWTAEGSKKFIVLMTDGQITDQWRPKDPFHPDNATVELQHQPSNRREKLTRRSDNLSAFYDQCNLAKQNGVVVFTIAFEAPSGGREEMRNCASSASHFFDVEGNEILDAFQTIARQINNLRLTQ